MIPHVKQSLVESVHRHDIPPEAATQAQHKAIEVFVAEGMVHPCDHSLKIYLVGDGAPLPVAAMAHLPHHRLVGRKVACKSAHGIVRHLTAPAEFRLSDGK